MMVFMIALAALLTIFIFTKGLDIYREGAAITEERNEPTISCLGYAYSIKNIDYADRILSFDLTHLSYSDSENISSITVLADKAVKAEMKPMVRGASKRITFENLTLASTFSVYPDRCSMYAMVCDMGSKVCR
ncbi:hypothetical protein JXB11_01490 [Candidatus Woesearchaeota archaeon]|nr:hypothetical protein [Candidatus Woesearchaeota archaeon]